MARPGVIPCSAPFDSAEEWSLLNTTPQWSSRPGGYAGSREWRTRAGPIPGSLVEVRHAPSARG